MHSSRNSAALAAWIVFLVLGAPSPTSAQQADTIITVRAAATALAFVPATIFVKQGTRVTLRLVNEGILPHNFVLVRNEDDIDVLAGAAMEEGGDYVPSEMRDKLIAFTTLASPAQTVEVTFVAPPAGTYTYVCLMSGHAGMMLGTLRSQR